MRNLVRATAAAVIAAAALVGPGNPALAECMSQVNRFPEFTDVASSAKTVVIGTVVKSRREDPTEATVLFTLRVDDVLRGDPAATLDIDGLRSGLALRGAESCRENAFLYARVGDVIALALDGRLEGRTGINTAAWIEGRPARLLMPAGQVLTRNRAIAAAKALPPSDTVAVPRLGGADLVALLARAVAGALAGMGTRDRQH